MTPWYVFLACVATVGAFIMGLAILGGVTVGVLHIWGRVTNWWGRHG